MYADEHVYWYAMPLSHEQLPCSHNVYTCSITNSWYVAAGQWDPNVIKMDYVCTNVCKLVCNAFITYTVTMQSQ